ncbi:biotin carboxylase subunit of acetyl CoA carboxylase, putative [Plasmodium ovale]|uniref:Biotin carboxylase subunit of acetyl CoA carboxylase, putative n=1 Tax=Plasmodium ovale TaxID=36330 RepID=A0A1D3TKU7_PLAOA|nr:biotin carboxylase subunit of acetyl CoA carboxylase, putative [Plasmodium ovale]
MINSFLSIFLFVLIFENLVESVKSRNSHYIHMHNNVDKNNINEIETKTREKYGNVRRHSNVRYDNYKKKFMPLYLSKGTDALNPICKSSNKKQGDRFGKDSSFISRDISKIPSYSHNLHGYPNLLDSHPSDRKWNVSEILDEKHRNEEYLTEKRLIEERFTEERLTGENAPQWSCRANNETKESFTSFMSNDDYLQSSFRESYYSNNPNDGSTKNKSSNKKGSYFLEDMSDNFASCNIGNDMNMEENIHDKKESSNISAYVKSKSDMIFFDSSDEISRRGEVFNKMRTRKKKKNLNKLFYSFKLPNNVMLLKRRGYFDKHNSQGGYKISSREAKGGKTDQAGEDDIGITGQDDASAADGVSAENATFLTYEEKNIMKKRAFVDYSSYIRERRYPYFNFLKKKNEKIVKKLLIANNGMAALKCILSLKEWLFKRFYDEDLIKIIVLATQDDIESNAKYISLADKVVKVPSGKNTNNYANVSLIVDIAKKEDVDAVWPGWGHSSENPLLSTMLERENIIFIGPTGKVMEALGDKISANILAQSVNVPVVKWSGENIKIENFGDRISDDVYNKSTIHSLDECIKECKRIGFPVMIKASQGGGGKGIRKVQNENETKKAYEQVQNELPDSPIFLMKVCNNVRHIEIQVIGDMYGSVCSLSGRDCTMQRRFQKIFEEGPPLVVPEPIFREMEKASIRLTKMIKYRGAGTIEYLYDQVRQKYFFLELNPRLQVEHPVSEGITNTNLISIQLQVAMGIPLQNIDDIKRLYKIDDIQCEYRNESQSLKRQSNGYTKMYESGCVNKTYNDFGVSNGVSKEKKSMSNSDMIESIPKRDDQMKDLEMFDFYNNRPYVKNHVIAARITAENSNDSFKPTSGKVKRIYFQNSKDVWGYFSINDGFVHEYSDSQIGHIFAKGKNREIARKNLILSLRKLNIDGDIKTVTRYLAKILETKAFIDNNITTNWLDTVIEGKKYIYYNAFHIIIFCAAIFKLLIHFTSEKENVVDALYREDIAIKPKDAIIYNVKNKMKNAYIFDITFQNVKYNFKSFNTGENLYNLQINEQRIELFAEYDKENNKVFTSFNDQTYIYTCSEDSLGIHMQLKKDNIFIPKITNPYQLISNTNGKIVKYLVKDGDNIKKNEDYVEIEAMKMIMTFKATETGILKHKMSEGTIIKIGDLLGVIEKRKERNEQQEEKNEIKEFTGKLDLSNKQSYELDNSELPSGGNICKMMNNSREVETTLSCIEKNNIRDEVNSSSLSEGKTRERKTSSCMSAAHEDFITEDMRLLRRKERRNSADDMLYEQDDTSLEVGNRKNKLFLRKKKNNIFRLFSNKNQCNREKAANGSETTTTTTATSTAASAAATATNYLNDKFNCVKTYLTNLNFPSVGSTSNAGLSPNESTPPPVDEVNSSSATQSGQNDSANTSFGNTSIGNNSFGSSSIGNTSLSSDQVNILSTEHNVPNCKINNQDRLSSEVVLTQNAANEKMSSGALNKNETNHKTASKTGEDARKESGENNGRGCDQHSGHIDHGESLLDYSNMKRIEFLLKGYEQDYEKCFSQLVQEGEDSNLNSFFCKVNYILEKFIEYNALFSKREIITEVEMYDILYTSISDKKKQYEIVHAYTYNYMSVKFVEKILSYLLHNSETELPLDILDKIKTLGTFRGKIFGSIILLAKSIAYLTKYKGIVKRMESVLNHGIVKGNNETEKQTRLSPTQVRQSTIMDDAKREPEHGSEPEELLKNRNYGSIVHSFLKHPLNIHMFLPSMLKQKWYDYPTLLEIYIRNLYKYFTVKTVTISDICIKFSINGSRFDNLLLLNEKDTIDVESNLWGEETNGNTNSINNVHIINKSETFFDSLYRDKSSIIPIMNKCNKLYVYNYSQNRYGDIYEWKGNQSKDMGNIKMEKSRTNMLPFEKNILSFEEICKNYDLHNLGENIFSKTKIYQGSYKKNSKNTSLFAQRMIDLGDIKQLCGLNENTASSTPRIGSVVSNSSSRGGRGVWDILMRELREAVEDITLARMNPSVHDAKVSSYVIYSVVINGDNVSDNGSSVEEQIKSVKDVCRKFFSAYNELLIENYVNGVYIRVYTKRNQGLSMGSQALPNIQNIPEDVTELKLERTLKLHVVFDNEKELVEEVSEIPPFEIDAMYLKRKRARDVDTVYAYDFIKLIDVALNRENINLHDDFNYISSIKEFKMDYARAQKWEKGGGERSREGCKTFSEKDQEEDEKNAVGNSTNDAPLFNDCENVTGLEAKIKRSLYLSDTLDVGKNKMSVIGLLMNVKTNEYREGRDIVFIINDITTFGGSFSVLEDEFFYGISCFAREKKIPRIYISCNSGARIGLYNFLMDKIKVCWKDESKKELGYNYIYITEDVKEKIAKDDILFLREHIENNEKRYIIDGIVGNLNNNIGVENLRGSGLIAGETSKAYDEIFTLSYVTGRSVGIGAYLVRLGKRSIQKKGSSLLLTGFNALNKILGEKVYVSNEQLGGVKIMMRNGISQLDAENDQDGVNKIFQWLSYVPKRSIDSYEVIERMIKNEHIQDEKNYLSEETNFRRKTVDSDSMDYGNKGEGKSLGKSKIYVRHLNDVDTDNLQEADMVELIRGVGDRQGFLDKGSYFEYMNEWGKGIITGRGKLGSIPVGFIAVNKNLVTQVVPCDPALKTKAIKSTYAPCVFLPDNSYKTAQAIEDFNKENLPLFVFANWRGFSGGTMDMFNSILKFGSMIVNQLVNYKHPVFVYIPIFGELRGGSWVVVDETLNSQMIEMYADTNSKGGILEPPGIVEVKFKLPEIKKLMHSIDTSIIQLKLKLENAQGEEEISKIKKEIEAKEKELLPFYLQVCHRYADLHDVSACMKSKGVVRKIVPWEKARSFFYYRLLRRLLMNYLNKKYGNRHPKSAEIDKLINDINISEEDDYEVCKKFLNDDILNRIKEMSDDMLYRKTMDDFFKAFQNLPKKQKSELFKKISSYEY